MKSNLNPAELFIRDARGRYAPAEPGQVVVEVAETILRERVNRKRNVNDGVDLFALTDKWSR
ncbi:MAG: hypothetical protein ACYDB9_12235 [Gammaproteobacteria bacterium]